MVNKNQEEPTISPQHTEPVHHISTTYPAKQCCDECKREKQQHEPDKKSQRIDTVDPLKRFQQYGISALYVVG